MDRTAVLNARLATQRLSGPPAISPGQVVRELLCVQAQDAPLARAMIALRCAGATDETVRGALAAGEIVRTHVLRPTWHYVAARDLVWLLRLTSPKVESAMAARHRQLGLDEPRVDAGMAVVTGRLAGLGFTNRAGLGTVLAEAGVLTRDNPLFGQQAGHLLMLAELRGLICSAPVATAEHRYALVEEVVPKTPDLDRESAITQLVRRFVAGHGPVALPDLTRWARVTLAEARAALSGLGEEVARLTVDGEELWYAPASQLPAERQQGAWLLSTFDEALLSYRKVGWPLSAEYPAGADVFRFAEAGGGVVIFAMEAVGTWKRTRGRGAARIELVLAESLPSPARPAIDEAVDRLLAAIG